MKLISPLCAVSLAFWLSPLTVRADSDGYYCATPNYLAYELQFTSGPDQRRPNGHTLFVLWLATDAITHPLAMRLAEFQVHGMRCTETAVELAGWDTVYVVSVGRDQGPTLISLSPRSSPGGAPPGFQDTNLSAWASSVREGRAVARVPLPASHGRAQHVLEIRYGPHASREHCRYQVQTHLSRAAAPGKSAKTVLLATGDFKRDCH